MQRSVYVPCVGGSIKPQLYADHLKCSSVCPNALFSAARFTVRFIGRLRDHGCLSKPSPLVKDGDLVSLVQHMIRVRGVDTVRVTKDKARATDADVEQGRVSEEDKIGNDEADTAADLGRRPQSEAVMDARRVLLNGISQCFSFIASWLLVPGFLSIMMAKVGQSEEAMQS